MTHSNSLAKSNLQLVKYYSTSFIVNQIRKARKMRMKFELSCDILPTYFISMFNIFNVKIILIKFILDKQENYSDLLILFYTYSSLRNYDFYTFLS